MWDFNSREGVQAYVDENGVEALRELAAGGRLGPERRPFVRQWLVEYYRRQQALVDARRAEEARTLGERTATAAEAQVAEAKRSADAAEISANAAVDSAIAAKASAYHAKIAWSV